MSFRVYLSTASAPRASPGTAAPVSSVPESTAKADRPRVGQAGSVRRAMVSVQCSAVTGVPSWKAAFSSRWNRAAVPPSALSQEDAARGSRVPSAWT